MRKLLPLVLTLTVACTGLESSDSEYACEQGPPDRTTHVARTGLHFQKDPCADPKLVLAREVVNDYAVAASEALDTLISLCGSVAGVSVSGDRHAQASELCRLAAEKVVYYRSIGTLVTEAPAAVCDLPLAIKRDCQARCGAKKCTPMKCNEGVMTDSVCTIGGSGSLTGGCIDDLRCETLCVVNSSVTGNCWEPTILFDYSGPSEFQALLDDYYPALYAHQQYVDSMFRFGYNLAVTVGELESRCPSGLASKAYWAFEDVSACLVPVAAAIIVAE